MKLWNKKPAMIISVVLISVILLGSIYYLTMYPRRGTVREFDVSMPLGALLSKKEAEQDLTYLYNHLRSRHPVWLDGSQALTQAVENQYNIELANLNDSVTVLELWQSAGRIAAQLNDGHTWVKWKNPNTTLYIDNFYATQRLWQPSGYQWGADRRNIGSISFDDLFRIAILC